MKKSWYMLILMLCGLVLGDIIAHNAGGSFGWLGYTAGFEFQPGTFAIANVFNITFGFNFYISVAQVLMIISAFFVYYKTSAKICG